MIQKKLERKMILKVADKIKIENKEFMCTQILLLEHVVVYRMHEVLGDKSLFMLKKDNVFEEVQDKRILEEIYHLIHIKNTDVIIN